MGRRGNRKSQVHRVSVLTESIFQLIQFIHGRPFCHFLQLFLQLGLSVLANGQLILGHVDMFFPFENQFECLFDLS